MGRWGSNLRPADYEKYGRVHRTHYLHPRRGVAAQRWWLADPGSLAQNSGLGLLWFGLYMITLNWGERDVDAGTAAMLVNIGPILLALLGGWLLHEGFPRRLAAGMAVSFGGAVLDCTMQSMMIICIHDRAHHPGRARNAVRTMKIRAAQSGQSLQAYLRSLIEREAARPTVAEAVEQARRQATADISTTDILAAIDEGRTGR